MNTLIKKQADTLEKNLVRLAVLLSSGQFLTAAQSSAILECSKPSVYAWLSQLKERGYKFRRRRQRDANDGPPAWAYAVVDSPSKEDAK